jgi:hypothetical protein
MSRVLEVRALPDGRYRIHWFIFDPDGPVSLPQGTIETSHGPMKVGGSIPTPDGIVLSRGRIACEPQRTSVLPDQRRGTIRMCLRSDDPRAVSCPECQATAEYKAAMANLETLVTPPNIGATQQ